MQLEFRVEGKTLDEIEANAQAECEQMADGRSFTFKLGELFSSDRGLPASPSPFQRIAAGHADRTFSGYVTATFEDRTPAAT